MGLHVLPLFPFVVEGNYSISIVCFFSGFDITCHSSIGSASGYASITSAHLPFFFRCARQRSPHASLDSSGFRDRPISSSFWANTRRWSRLNRLVQCHAQYWISAIAIIDSESHSFSEHSFLCFVLTGSTASSVSTGLFQSPSFNQPAGIFMLGKKIPALRRSSGVGYRCRTVLRK